MPVRIRTAEGELSYVGVEEVRQALKTGLVDASDEISLSESEPWRPVREVLGSPQWRWRDHFQWYVLTALLIGMFLLGAGLLWYVLLVSTSLLWFNMKRRAPRSGNRWW